jgi:two-component system response regulator AtoC
MTGKYILVADDEPKMRRVLEMMLQRMGHRVLVAADGREALAVFSTSPVDLVIADMRMPEVNGLELLAALREQGSDVPVIVITAHGTIETAVAAMKRGAFDYVLRPFDIDVLEVAVNRALESSELARHNHFLREEAAKGWEGFVGDSAPMQAIYELIRKAGPARAPVLITGETGTGKELAARAIHNASTRRDKLFVAINCAAIPGEMLESELFGYERGAFTGAIKDRVGKFQLADGGTIFLDELTEMPMALQAKLLRVLQEGKIERLGSNRAIDLDVRVIAATNRDPRGAMREGRLREDLYYRVNVVSIDLPALRQRREDIPLLVEHFIAKHCGSRRAVRLSARALERLSSYAWPGNVRELENMIERALIVSNDDVLDESHFLFESTVPPLPAVVDDRPHIGVRPLTAAVEALESQLIDQALAQANGSKAKAAALLDISERTLWYKLKKRAGESVEDE